MIDGTTETIKNASETIKMANDLNQKSERIRKFTSGIAGSVSAIAAGITISLAVGLFSDGRKNLSQSDLTEKVIAAETKIIQLSDNIDKIQYEFQQLEMQLDALTNLPVESEWKPQVVKLQQHVQVVEKKLSGLEDALTVDPVKSLAIPILRKDLDNSEKNLRSELIQTKSEINRIYDQNKWFLGLMFTMTLSVLGMALGSFFNKKDT